jgi:LacI family transcriptional regulator
MGEDRIGVAEMYQRLLPSFDAMRTVLRGESEELGYELAFVFTSPAIVDPTHPFFGPLVRAAHTHAAYRGIDVVMLAPSREDWLEADSLERCAQNEVAGIVVLGGADGNPDVLRRRWPGLATVFVEYDTLGTRSAHVGIDNESAFAEIVFHLSQQRARIATITGILTSRPASERLNGYRDVLRRLGYTSPPEYIQVGDWSPESGYECMQRLLALPDRPDAVACACDVQAVGAMQAIEEAGLRCPDDIAVTGFDDADFGALLAPALTTVRQPSEEIGIAAIDAIVDMLRDPALPPPNILKEGQLVVRESCGIRAEPLSAA